MLTISAHKTAHSSSTPSTLPHHPYIDIFPHSPQPLPASQTSPSPKPLHQSPQPHRNAQVPRSPPRHRKQILGTKHRPDKQMRPQRRATRHYARQHDAREKREQRHMVSPQRTTPHFLRRRCIRLRLLMQKRVLLLDPAPRRLVFLLCLLGALPCGGPFFVAEE